MNTSKPISARRIHERVVLRADAGRSVGYGHVMRCITLGAELARRGDEVTLLGTGFDRFLSDRADRFGIRLVPLTASSGSCDDLREVSELAPTLVVIDGYHFSCEYVDALSSTAFTLAIDDNGALHAHTAHLVLNQNSHASPTMYPGMDERSLLLGPSFALIRDEVREARARRSTAPYSDRLSILIAIGGTDVLGIAGDVAAVLRDHFDGQIIASTEDPATGVERAPADIARSLATCDAAVIGGGSTMWESCFLGTPAIAVIVADNQADAAADAAERGVCDVIDCRDDRDPTRIVDAALRLVGSPDRRSLMSATGISLVDGAGAERVVNSLRTRVAA